MIEASTRLSGVEQLIDTEQYFVIHAARQSGKTTCLKDLARRLNASGKYYVLYCSLESMQEVKDPRITIPEIVKKIKNALFLYNIPQSNDFAKDADYGNFTSVLYMSLTMFCTKLDKPLVLLFDEADCLSDEALIAFLRQLRDGYNNRPDLPFVHSIALTGMRNIRDYKARIRPDSQSLGSASPFNIVTKSLALKNFTSEEISSLYQQHTDETGQVFEKDAVELVWQQTQGQPWIVNAIAREVTVEMLKSDCTQAVTAELVEKAIQNIILRRDTHIDSLLERLKEERIRKVIEPIITGEDVFDRLSDDLQYVVDMGLITNIRGRLTPANPIYSEVIARTLTYNMQEKLMEDKSSWQMSRYIKSGRIDMNLLMRDFQQFWRENSDIWLTKFDYEEAAPHLILMAFLQRIINGGGRIIREMAAGTGRLDICLIYEEQKYPIELKLWRGEKSLKEGINQTLRSMDVYGSTEGWLAIFDRNPQTPWNRKIYMDKQVIEGQTVTVVGL
jgi:hypothetical protein